MGKHREEQEIEDHPTVQDLWDKAESEGGVTSEMKARRMRMKPHVNAPQHSIADTPRSNHEIRVF